MMSGKHWYSLVAKVVLCIFLFWAPSAMASTISFDMDGAVVNVGDVFNVDLLVTLDQDSVGFNRLSLEIDDVQYKDELRLDAVTWDSDFESYITGMGSGASDLFRYFTVYSWGDVLVDITKGSAPILDYSGPILNMTFTAMIEGTAYLDAEDIDDFEFQSYSEYTPPYIDEDGYHTGVYIRSAEEEFDPGTIIVTSNAVPEPATMLLLGSGLIGLAGFRRKKKR